MIKNNNCTLIDNKSSLNILNLIKSIERQVPKLEETSKQGWRMTLVIGSIIYFKEENKNDEMIRGVISEIYQDVVFVVDYEDKSGNEKQKLIGRWSSQLYFPQIEHEIIQEWRQNLKIGYQVLFQKDYYKPWIACTVISLEYDKEQQKLEKVKIAQKVYHHRGDKSDQNGNYFGPTIINEGQHQLWVNLPSLQLMPNYLFEASQGNLRILKYLKEEICEQDYDFSVLNLPDIYAESKLEKNFKVLGTPLYAASESGNYEIVKLLLEYEEQIDFRTYYDISPFIISFINNHFDIAELLIQHGAQINVDTQFEVVKQQLDKNKDKINEIIEYYDCYPRIIKFLHFKKYLMDGTFNKLNRSLFGKVVTQYY
eukprot:403375712